MSDDPDLLAQADALIAERGLTSRPVRSLAEADRVLSASRLEGPGFLDVLRRVRAALGHSETGRAIERARAATTDGQLLMPRRPPPREQYIHDAGPSY